LCRLFGFKGELLEDLLMTVGGGSTSIEAEESEPSPVEQQRATLIGAMP
jgi:hypothetical protein